MKRITLITIVLITFYLSSTLSNNKYVIKYKPVNPLKRLLLTGIVLITFYLSIQSNTLNNQTYIVRYEAINPYEKVWSDICFYESTNNPLAFNPKEYATGIVQIRPIRLVDYNRRTGSHYKLSDCYNVEISKKIFMYYACKFSPDEYDKIATDWNKCKTDEYYNNVLFASL